MTLKSVGKQGKYKLCFNLRIKSYAQRVKLTMGFVNVEKITLAKQIEKKDGQNIIMPLKILSQQGI